MILILIKDFLYFLSEKFEEINFCKYEKIKPVFKFNENYKEKRLKFT